MTRLPAVCECRRVLPPGSSGCPEQCHVMAAGCGDPGPGPGDPATDHHDTDIPGFARGLPVGLVHRTDARVVVARGADGLLDDRPPAVVAGHAVTDVASAPVGSLREPRRIGDQGPPSATRSALSCASRPSASAGSVISPTAMTGVSGIARRSSAVTSANGARGQFMSGRCQVERSRVAAPREADVIAATWPWHKARRYVGRQRRANTAARPPSSPGSLSPSRKPPPQDWRIAVTSSARNRSRPVKSPPYSSSRRFDQGERNW